MPSNPYDAGLLGSSGRSNPFDTGLFTPVAPKKPKKPKKKPKATKKQVETLLRAAQKGDMATFDYLATKLELTANQRAVAIKAAEFEGSGKDRSFGDKLKGVGGAALGGASWALDKIMRPSYAVSAAASEALKGDQDWTDVAGLLSGGYTALKNPRRTAEVAGAAWSGLKGETKKGFGEVLEEQGALEGHRRLRGAAGFYLDVMTDPTMALSLAAAPVTGGGSTAAYLAAKQAGTRMSKRALEGAMRDAGQRAIAGETDDVIEELLAAGGKKYQHRLGVFKANKSFKEDAQNVMKLSAHDMDARYREIHAAQRMAQAESRVYDPRKLAFVIGTGKHNVKIPTYIPILTRPGAKLAEREIPVVSQLSDKLGKAFIPGFKNDIMNAGSLARKQAGEYNAVVQKEVLGTIFKGMDERMPVESMLDALHYMEQPLKGGRWPWKAVLKDKKTGVFSLNAKYLDELQSRGLIDDAQRDFIERYYRATSYLNKADISVGLKYDNFAETGRMYVPHVVRPGEDVAKVTQHNLLTQAGFEHGRKAELSLKQMKELAEQERDLRIFEYDPMLALARRSRAGAERQADMALLNTLKTSVGKPTRIVDKVKLKHVEARIDKATKQHEGALRVAAAAEQAVDNKIAQLRDELDGIRAAASMSAGKVARQTLKTQKQQRIKKLEDEIDALKKGTIVPAKGKGARAPKPKAEVPEKAAPRVPAGMEGLRPDEVKALETYAKVRKELDDLDAARAPAAELPGWFSSSSRMLRPSKGKSRRDNARAFLDRAEERILKRRQTRTILKGDAPVETIDKEIATAVEKAKKARAKGDAKKAKYFRDKAARLRAAKKKTLEKAEAPAPAPKPKAKGKAKAAPTPKPKPRVPVEAKLSPRSGKLWHTNVFRPTGKGSLRKIGSVWQKEKDGPWFGMVGKEGEEIGPFTARKKAIAAVDTATLPKAAPAPKPKAEAKPAAAKSKTPSTGGRAASGKPKRQVDKARIAELEAEIRKVRASKYGDRVAAQTGKELARMEKEYEKAIAALEKPKTKEFQQLVGEDFTTLKTAQEVLRESKREVANAKKALDAARAGKPNKEVNRKFYVSSELDEHGNPWAFPEEAFDTVTRLEKIVSGADDAVDDFSRGWGKFMAMWKIAMTTFNPTGYRLRNSMTDYWNMWVAGVPNAYITKYGYKAAKILMDKDNMTDPAKMAVALRWMQEASDHGVMAGLFAGDIQNVAQMFKHAQRSRRYLLKNAKFIQLYTKVTADMNRTAENWGRLTHYMYRREHLGESAAEAAFRVKIAHFDYEDLTAFEQKYMKRVFPFYTWTRKNIPYQVRQIMARPGRYSAFPKLAQEAEYAAGDEQDQVPGYMSKNFAISLPFGNNKFLMPQFGVSDLSVFESKEGIADRVKSLMGPQIKVPGELITGKSFFTGQEIAPEGHPRVPFSGRGAGLLDLIPGTDIGQTSRVGPGGTDVDTPGMNPWASWALGQLPMARAAFGLGAGTEDKQNQQYLSYLAGLSAQSVDPEMQAYYDRLKVEDQVAKIVSGLRDEGRAPRTDKSKSNFEILIEQILSGDY